MNYKDLSKVSDMLLKNGADFTCVVVKQGELVKMLFRGDANRKELEKVKNAFEKNIDSVIKERFDYSDIVDELKQLFDNRNDVVDELIKIMEEVKECVAKNNSKN